MADDMSLMKKLLVAWVMGFAFALLLMERWRRMGTLPETVAPAPEEGPPADDVETRPSPLAQARRIASGVAESVSLGMKADVDRVRETLRPAVPTAFRQNKQVEKLEGGMTAAAR